MRRRRSPEVARQELLEAAERLFTKDLPGEVGLKDVGREAGVSHALVTAVAAATGYSIMKPSLAGAIGRPPSRALDLGVRKTLATMLQGYLRDAIGLK